MHARSTVLECRPQVAVTEDAEAIKASVAVLKKVCRQRTMVAWKEWRASMAAHCGASLRVRHQMDSCLACSWLILARSAI